jgi:hypothetical protein
MTLEEQIAGVLQALAGGQVYPDVAPANTAPPYITYQVVGGEPINFMTGEKPSATNARLQVNAWARSRIEASQLGVQIEDAIRAAVVLLPEVISGRVSTFDEATKYRGTMQDFSVWY